MFIIFVGCKSADKYPWRTLLSFLFPCRTRLGRSRPWHPESRAWAPLLQRQRGSGGLRATSWRKHRGNDSNVMGRQRSSELVQNVQTLAFFHFDPTQMRTPSLLHMWYSVWMNAVMSLIPPCSPRPGHTPIIHCPYRWFMLPRRPQWRRAKTSVIITQIAPKSEQPRHIVLRLIQHQRQRVRRSPNVRQHACPSSDDYYGLWGDGVCVMLWFYCFSRGWLVLWSRPSK